MSLELEGLEPLSPNSTRAAGQAKREEVLKEMGVTQQDLAQASGLGFRGFRV